MLIHLLTSLLLCLPAGSNLLGQSKDIDVLINSIPNPRRTGTVPTRPKAGLQVTDLLAEITEQKAALQDYAGVAKRKLGKTETPTSLLLQSKYTTLAYAMLALVMKISNSEGTDVNERIDLSDKAIAVEKLSESVIQSLTAVTPKDSTVKKLRASVLVELAPQIRRHYKKGVKRAGSGYRDPLEEALQFIPWEQL